MVAMLTAINLLNYADRYLIGGLQELLKGDPTFLGGPRDASGLLQDAGLGALTTAFFVVYMLASPFTGYLGDRISRKHLIAAGVALWSIATVASGMARTYSELLAARALIGVGEATYAVVAPSLIADLFRVERRGRAMGVFYSAIPLGAAIGFAVGGAIGQHYGWRSAFYVAGLPGLLLAVAILFFNEPRRGATDTPAAPEPARAPRRAATPLGALARNRYYLTVTVGMTLMTFAIGGLANWMPAFLHRAAGLTPAEAGPLFGALTAIAGLLGTGLGTWLGEVATRRHRHGYLLVSGAGLLLAACATLPLALAQGRAAILALSFAALLLAMLNTGPLNTALVNSLPASMRATGVALNIFAIHAFGDAASPTLIGLLSDWSGSLSLAVGANALPLLVGGAVLVSSGWRSGRPTIE